MALGLIGKKVGMTQIYLEDGTQVGVTVIQLGESIVVQKRTKEKDGYLALQVGFEDLPLRKVKKAAVGHFKKANTVAKRHLREFRVEEDQIGKYTEGQALPQDMFSVGDHVDVIGTSRGLGFAGVMKRYHFAGFPKTRGTHEYRRHPGSIGARETPGRIHPGKRMGGHMGAERVTSQNLKIVRIAAEEGYVFLNGPVPGKANALVLLQPAMKARRAAAKAKSLE